LFVHLWRLIFSSPCIEGEGLDSNLTRLKRPLLLLGIGISTGIVCDWERNPFSGITLLILDIWIEIQEYWCERWVIYGVVNGDGKCHLTILVGCAMGHVCGKELKYATLGNGDFLSDQGLAGIGLNEGNLDRYVGVTTSEDNH
jgi:hypothetical protein